MQCFYLVCKFSFAMWAIYYSCVIFSEVLEMSFNDLLILTMFQVFNLEAVIIKPPSTDLFSTSEFYPSVFSDISIELNFNQVNHRKPPPLPDLLSSQPSSELQFPNISEDLLQTVTHQDQSILKPPAPALYNTILEGQFLQDIGDPLHNKKCSPETQVVFKTQQLF